MAKFTPVTLETISLLIMVAHFFRHFLKLTMFIVHVLFQIIFGVGQQSTLLALEVSCALVALVSVSLHPVPYVGLAAIVATNFCSTILDAIVDMAF